MHPFGLSHSRTQLEKIQLKQRPRDAPHEKLIHAFFPTPPTPRHPKYHSTPQETSEHKSQDELVAWKRLALGKVLYFHTKAKWEWETNPKG